MPSTAPPSRFQRVLSADTSANDFLEIEIGGRTAQVFRPIKKGKRAANYYLKGYPPKWKKKAYCKSTGFATKGLALEAAKKLWAAVLKGRFDVLKEVEIKGEKTLATIGQLIAAHEKEIHNFNLTVGKPAVRAYRGSLRRLVFWSRQSEADSRKACGECERLHLTKAQVAAVDRESAGVLSEDLIEQFLQRYLAPAGGNYEKRENRINGALAAIRFARAMFDPVALKCYRALQLPDLKGFMGATVPDAPKRKPRVVGDATIAEMGAVANWLRQAQPELYLVHLLFRHFGLGNDEIEHAQVGWITPAGAGDPRGVCLPDGDCRPIAAFLAVRWRNDWRAKTEAREGRVAISPDVYAELMPWLTGRGAEERLVPAATSTARADLIDRAHNDFVRHWLVDFKKKSYELRRWGANKVTRLHQSDTMGSAFLRHSPKTTATRFYTEDLMPAPLTLADVGCYQ